MTVSDLDLLALRDGAYRLERRVSNPCVDRRKRYDWRYAETFEPGPYFLTVFRREHAIDVYVRHGRLSLRAHAGLGRDGWRWVGPTAPAADRLLIALRPDESLEGALQFVEAEYDAHAREVLLRLVRAGAVSESAVRDALAEVAPAPRGGVDG